MSTIGVHTRVSSRHPEVTDDDVVVAMRAMIAYTQRSTGEWVAVGLDNKNRLIELAYHYDEDDDFFLVFHAMVPPSSKTLRELRLER